MSVHKNRTLDDVLQGLDIANIRSWNRKRLSFSILQQ